MSKNKIERKMFLENLSRWEENTRYNGKINWKECEGYKVKFIYDDIEGWIEILNYNKNTRMLTVRYKEVEYDIKTDHIINCNIGKIIGKVTIKFKVKIGTRFQDDKRDIIITDREYRLRYKKDGSKCNDKWYKYTCNVCHWTEGWITEGDLLRKEKRGCSCCYGRTLVEGINDIPTTAPEIIKYFQGGYDEAKLYTKWGSGNPSNKGGYIYPICPDCGRIKDKSILITNIYRTHSIGCSCSDKISFGEKLMFSVLEQLNVKFVTQLGKNIYDWCNVYKYDFHFEFNNKKYIIETHGDQHYKQQRRKGARTLEEEQENDKLKKELAIKNGIKEDNYIVIDCRKSELEWIKQNILESNLAKVFDLSKIDWNKCNEFALGNKVKEACNIKKNNPDLTTTEIGIIMKLHEDTIRKYLKKGNELGWCHYDVEEEKVKGRKRNSGIYVVKPIKIFKDESFLGEFESASELERQSEKLFGVQLRISGILKVCKGKVSKYKGYIFEYIE